MANKVYLGDGVFVSNYYGDLKLETERDGVTHWIVLGPSEYRALQEYVATASATTAAQQCYDVAHTPRPA